MNFKWWGKKPKPIEFTDEHAKVLMLWNLGHVHGGPGRSMYFYTEDSVRVVDVSDIINQLVELGMIVLAPDLRGSGGGGGGGGNTTFTSSTLGWGSGGGSSEQCLKRSNRSN